MRALPRVFICVLPLLASIACGPDTPPPPPPEPAGFEPFQLADGERREVTVTFEGEGEAVLSLEGTLSGASWGTAEHESVTLEVIVDHKLRRHLIWTDTPAGTHTAAVGKLAAGEHTLRITRLAEQTRAHSATLKLTAATLTLSPEQTLARYAPILLGRDDSASTDLPLILYGKQRPDGALEYTVVFSNEDGGTGANPKVLVAEWGRLSDIEWTLTVERDADGNATARTFQGLFHNGYPFTGPMEGEHPLLGVATNNGVFADDGEPSPFRLGLPVIAFDPGAAGEPREAVVDDWPGAVELIDAEGVREQKIDPTCTDPSKVWLTKCYAYVDVTVSATGLGDRRLWGLEATTASGEKFRSEADLGVPGRLDRTGRVRVAIPMGPDPQVAELKAYAVDDGQGPFEITVSKPKPRRWTGTEWKVEAAGDKAVTLTATEPEAVLWP